MKRRFKVIKAEAGDFHTTFSIKDLDHANDQNLMAPESFFHHIGGLCGRRLDRIEGLEFEIILPTEKAVKRNFDPLDLCGR